MFTLFRGCLLDDEGQDIAEYAVMVAVILIIAIGRRSKRLVYSSCICAQIHLSDYSISNGESACENRSQHLPDNGQPGSYENGIASDTPDLIRQQGMQGQLWFSVRMVRIELPHLPKSLDEARQTPDCVDGEGSQS